MFRSRDILRKILDFADEDRRKAVGKPVYDFLFAISELFFSLALTVEALQGKTCQDSLPSGVGLSLIHI